MQFSSPLIRATLIRRYKRFLADVVLPDGRSVTVHTPNTGAMSGCAEPGSEIWLRDTASPTRKYPLAWELSSDGRGTLIGVNTHLANALVMEGIEQQVISELQGYRHLRREVCYGIEGSRIDLLLQHPGRADCYVEVKSVTLSPRMGLAAFPDAVSRRGAKHLRELMAMVQQGDRAVLVFCVQRDDIDRVEAAASIDPEYAQTLSQAVQAGVEVLAYGAQITPAVIRLVKSLPVRV